MGLQYKRFNLRDKEVVLAEIEDMKHELAYHEREVSIRETGLKHLNKELEEIEKYEG